MNTIDLALQPTSGYINSFTRNTIDGCWEIEIGIPKSWVFDENEEIKCEIINQSDVGKLIKISPKNPDIVIDDLINFVQVIIETNEKIAKKEEEFTNKMKEWKGALEEEARKFYTELDELKSSSFKSINENFVKEKKETRGRKPKTEKNVSLNPDSPTNLNKTISQ
jgi:hypothetical protein